MLTGNDTFFFILHEEYAMSTCLEEPGHLAYDAFLLAIIFLFRAVTGAAAAAAAPVKQAKVPVRQEVVAKQRSMDKSLHDAAHEAGVAEIDEASQTHRAGGAGAGQSLSLAVFAEQSHFLQAGPPRSVFHRSSYIRILR